MEYLQAQHRRPAGDGDGRLDLVYMSLRRIPQPCYAARF